MKLFLGIDIGGTRVKVVVINEDGEILDSSEFLTNDSDPFQPKQWKDKVLSVINDKTYNLVNGDSEKLICGISAPGLPSSCDKMIWHMPKRLEGIENYNWAEELQREIWVINDAHSATLAEYSSFYAGQVKNMILLTLGTGVGGGVILNEKLYKGHLGRAGHFGHITLDTNGPMTMTNLPGSLEYAMGNFSVNERTHGKYQSTLELVEAYKKGDSLAAFWWLSSINKLAIGLASINNAFSPELIVIGGGISSAGDEFFIPLEKFMSLYEWKLEKNRVKIKKAQFGNLAGAVGAALFAKQKHKIYSSEVH